MNPDDTLTEALEDIAKQNKEKEAADKAAAQAKRDEIGRDLLPPPGKPWGDDGHPHIPIEDIVAVGKRLRPLEEMEVKKKMESIRQVGLLTSITETLDGLKGKPPRNQYRLRAGLHRCASRSDRRARASPSPSPKVRPWNTSARLTTPFQPSLTLFSRSYGN